MSLFDPYSYARLHELRQEQLARKARLNERLHSDGFSIRSELPIGAVVRALSARLARQPEGAGRQAAKHHPLSTPEA